jgi:hypothetical protein
MKTVADYLVFSLALIGASVIGSAIRSKWIGESVTLDEWDILSAFAIVAAVQFGLPWIARIVTGRSPHDHP